MSTVFALDTASFSLINGFNFTEWFVKFLNLEEAAAIHKLHYTRQHLFFLYLIQWPGTLWHFQKLMLRQELKHPVGLQTCWDGQSWAGLSWGETELANKGTLLSPCPSPLPASPVPGICGCSPWEWKFPICSLMPGSMPLECHRAPEAGRPQSSYCTAPGMSSSWAGMLTAHGPSWSPSIHWNSNSFGLLQPPLSHNHVPQPSLGSRVQC